MMKWQEVLLQEMGETLTYDRKKTLIKHMVDEKILLNQNNLKHFSFQDRDHKYSQAYAGSDLPVNR